ncbi:TIGR04283 family arsenosugar biosynthesis glycosyltransferase [Salibacteraceae bacterium]|jgi:rSAM/selenodomain-associated transferase 2|nr:hypothetical protein [Crocinitomicaceae bacterium]MDC1203965.1 TIGR04283 family arsenosugar biosynthesis glycosyltransferase [Salibacteraceae bacterium]|tara:strand:+ start:16678 stop:17373 length:696 start_codon:yes stop_codon:yes gene_type:complete
MKLSIIIPCLNEAELLPALLSRIKITSTTNYEIIVVDANSTDKTADIALEHNALLIQSSIARRSIQMDMGAKVATGDVLFFIHADSIPPQNFLEDIKTAVTTGYKFGCFRLKFMPSNGFLKFFEIFVGIPWLICRGGDQGLFITANFYKAVGGFTTSLHIMEDIDIIRKGVRKSKFAILQSRMKTSSRDYIKYGHFRLQFAFALVHLAYWLGVDSEKLRLKLKNYLKNGRV